MEILEHEQKRGAPCYSLEQRAPHVEQLFATELLGRARADQQLDVA